MSRLEYRFAGGSGVAPRIEDPVPLYYRLELALRRQIEVTELVAGAPLPSEHVLAQQFGVSRVTVRRALDRLHEDGLVVRRRGTRTVVAPHVARNPKIARNPTKVLGFEEEMRDLGLRPRATLLEAGTVPPPEWVSTLLGLAPGKEVVRVRRLGATDGLPLWLETRYFPRDIGQAVLSADLTSASLLSLIERELGLRIERSESHLEVALATPAEAELLGVKSGAALLLNRSVAWAEGGRAVEAVFSLLRGDRYKLVLRATRQVEHAELELMGAQHGRRVMHGRRSE